MKEPDTIMEELSKDSMDEGQSQEQWLDYLRDLKSAVDSMVGMVENEIDSRGEDD